MFKQNGRLPVTDPSGDPTRIQLNLLGKSHRDPAFVDPSTGCHATTHNERNPRGKQLPGFRKKY
jgi:hypothetical protein